MAGMVGTAGAAAATAAVTAAVFAITIGLTDADAAYAGILPTARATASAAAIITA